MSEEKNNQKQKVSNRKKTAAISVLATLAVILIIFGAGLLMGALFFWQARPKAAGFWAYLWKDWLRLVTKGLTDIRSTEGRLFWYLVAATIPGAMVGFLLEKKAETIFREPILIATMLILLGVLLYWADRKSAKDIEMNRITFKTSLIIGLSQALAIIPGVSRSGITMTMGLLMGLTREVAARFSFLLSAPIIFGAALVKLPHLILNPSEITIGFIIGIVKMRDNLYYQFALLVTLYFIAASIGGISLLVGERFRVPMVPFIAVISACGWIKVRDYLKVND